MVQLRLKKPNAILFDITGTVAKTKFIDKLLIPYIESNFHRYLRENWNTKQVQMDLEQLRIESDSDPRAPKIHLEFTDTSIDADIDSAYDYVRYCIDNRKENKAMTLLR